MPSTQSSPDLSIYLAGKVAKGDEIGNIDDWRLVYSRALQLTHAVTILSPDDPTLDERDPTSIFGHDCHLVKRADIVIANASTKMGVGTAQELLVAKYFSKPVFTVLPRDSHHRRTNLAMHDYVVPDWQHPFIVSTSDEVFDSLEDLIAFLDTHAFQRILGQPKTLSVIDDSIGHYLTGHSDTGHSRAPADD